MKIKISQLFFWFEMKKQTTKSIFHLSVLIITWKNEKRKKILFKSVYQKYNSFFDLKTKWILKFFHFSFSNFITKIEKPKNFLKFIIWFEIEKWIRKFWILFYEIGFKSKWIKKQSVYRKYNSFFDLKAKEILKNFHFSFCNFITKIVDERIFRN